MKTRRLPFLMCMLLVGCSLAVSRYLFHQATAQVMLAIAYLMLAHLIADFPLQTNWLYTLKIRSVIGLALHAATHSIVTAMIISNPLNRWPALVMIGLIHFAIDWLKPHWKCPALTGFLLDQAIHLTFLVVMATICPLQSTIPDTWLYAALAYAILPAALVGLWVAVVDRKPGNYLNCWMRRRLLDISQIISIPLAAIFLIPH